MSGPITWELIGLLIIFGGGVLGVWWRIERRIEKAEEAAHKMNEARVDEIIAVSKDLSDYKLHASDRFASNQQMRDVEARLKESIDRLTERIDNLPTKLVQEFARLVGSEDHHRQR